MEKSLFFTGKNALKAVKAVSEKDAKFHDNVLGNLVVSGDNVSFSNFSNMSASVKDGVKMTFRASTEAVTGSWDIDEAITYIQGAPDIKVATIPSRNTQIVSTKIDNAASYTFKAVQDGISVDVLLSNWDENANYFAGEGADPNNPELTYFINTDAFKDWGVPGSENYISKRSKAAFKVNYAYTSDPRFVIADNAVFNVHIPKDLGVDYFVIHCSGHNGAASAVEYTYGHEDKVYLDTHVMVPDDKGTTDVTAYLRIPDAEDYMLFNGNIENNKKFWASFDFYKYSDPKKKDSIVLPPVEKVNKPIDEESVYVTLTADGDAIATNVKALSGICLSEDKSCLFGVSDTYGLYKINFDGSNEQLWDSKENLDLEGITIDANGDLFACVENEQKVVKFSKANGYSSPEVVSTKDADKLVEVMKEFNNGFEGIAWYKDDEFFIGNQFKPITVVHYSLSKGILGTFDLKWDDELGGVTEIADLQYDSANNCLWVIDSRTSHIFKYDLEGNTIQGHMTKIGAAPNTESFVIDFASNTLYVAADNTDGSLWKFKLGE